MKITKKEIRECLSAARKPPFDWSTYEAGAYIFDNKVKMYITYNRQGMNEVVCNHKYVAIEDLTDLCCSYYTLKEAIDIAYDRINEMIQEESSVD